MCTSLWHLPQSEPRGLPRYPKLYRSSLFFPGLLNSRVSGMFHHAQLLKTIKFAFFQGQFSWNKPLGYQWLCHHLFLYFSCVFRSLGRGLHLNTLRLLVRMWRIFHILLILLKDLWLFLPTFMWAYTGTTASDFFPSMVKSVYLITSALWALGNWDKAYSKGS